MALKKVVAASQVMRVKALVAYIYADPGIGKTSLAYTAKDAILFDFDSGAHRAGKMLFEDDAEEKRRALHAEIRRSVIKAVNA